MKYTIDINDDLMRKAQLLTGIKSKRRVVENALKLLISVSTQHSIIELWGNAKLEEPLK
jgi:Arc/MetJ family transcription regulator